MALRLVQHIWGDELTQTVQLGLEYDPEPPFDSGTNEKASRASITAVKAGLEARGLDWAA